MQILRKSDGFLQQVQKLENLLLPGDADLGSQIGNFFRSLSDVAAAPADLAPRAVAIERGNSLADAFNSTAVQLEQLKRNTLERTDDAITALNTLTSELGSVNDKILSASQSGRSPNALMDLRDKLIDEISKLADITVDYSDRGVANVTIGSSGVGPSLVDGKNTTKVGYVERYDKIGGLQIILNPLSSQTPTSQLSSGLIAGLSQSYGAIRGVIDEVNSLASELTVQLNSQHKLGVTMDGSKGTDIFSTISVGAIRSPATSADVDVDITLLDPKNALVGELDLAFSEQTGLWELSGPGLSSSVTGKNLIKTKGFEIRISGKASDGDNFKIVPGSEAAAQIKFLLTRPHDFAAASPDLVTASNSNLSDAELDILRIEPKVYPENDSIDILANSLTAVEAKDFIRDGLIATVPAGTKEINLASFAKQASARFQFSELALQNATQLTFSRVGSTNDGPHTFNISYATAYPNDLAGNYWQDAAQLAKLLNDGILRNSLSQSLSDLGMQASGSGGSLTISSSTGNFIASGVGAPEVATGSVAITASVTDAVAASDLQIFTREGRHIAGVAFTDAQITEFMTAENGFDDSAVYTADYLNNTNSAYRNIDLNVSFAGGMFDLSTGSNGVGPVLAQGSSVVPANATLAQTMSVSLTNGTTHNIPIEIGSSASATARSMNSILNNSGIVADAETRIELFGFASTGVVSFELEAANRVPKVISADVTPTNLSNLAIAINKVSSETGVSAVSSADNSRLILVSNDGDDVAISQLGAASPSFFGRLIDKSGVAETSPIGSVTSSGAIKTPLATTNVVTDALISGPNVSSNTISGSGADLDISSDAFGTYSVTINSGGSGVGNPYVVGETFTIDGTLVGGSSSTHDVTITVTSVDANGVITGASATGFAPGITQAQTTISPTLTDGLGSGASFDVSLADGVATVNVNSAGEGYKVGDTITILGSAIGGADGVNDLVLTVASLDPNSMVSFGSLVSGSRIDAARFSGAISLSSSAAFSLTTSNGTSNASQNPTLGGFVDVQSNAVGDTKKVTYSINESLENGGAGVGGLRAVAPNATYQLTIPTGNSNIVFQADVSDTELSSINRSNVNKALVEEIRGQGPLASLSADTTVSQTQVVNYSFQRTEAVQPTIDSVSLSINGNNISVDLNDIDGLGTAASTEADVTAAIVRSINGAGLNITASTTAAAPIYGVTLTANNPGEAFTVEAFVFNDVNQTVPQTQFSLTSEIQPKSLPEDGTAVSVKYGEQIYQLTMVDGEVVVSGPEADRLTAFFDIDNRLQIFGGGSISGAAITVVGDDEIGQNSVAAASFGLTAPTSRLAGQLLSLTSGMDDLQFEFNGAAVTASIDLLGNITTNPSSVSGLNLRWDAVSPATSPPSGRLIAEFDGGLNTFTFPKPTNALGFKTADREISIDSGTIVVKSTDNNSFELSASATSLAGTLFEMDNLPFEDLLIFATGGGARSIGSEYAAQQEQIDTTKYEIRAVGDNGNVIEIWDADTGHSIATRVVSGDQQTTYKNFEFTLTGRVEDGDVFVVQQDAVGQNDARNLDAMINLQDGDKSDPSKIGFQDLFGLMIAKVGSSVNSSKIASEVQEENMIAAKEAEAEFAGVNLDTEAAALIEFQQAYQASARILSTARELFQSLMEVV